MYQAVALPSNCTYIHFDSDLLCLDAKKRTDSDSNVLSWRVAGGSRVVFPKSALSPRIPPFLYYPPDFIAHICFLFIDNYSLGLMHGFFHYTLFLF